MIDAEFVDRIAELATQGAKKESLALGEDSQYYWILRDGQYVQAVKRLHENRSILSVRSLADFALAHKAKTIWYNANEIVCMYTSENKIIGALDFSDRATVELLPSEAYEMLSKFGSFLKQEDLIFLLKTTFRGMFDPSSLLDTVSYITWASGDKGRSVQGQSSRSVGREIEASMDGRTNLPELVLFTIPMWRSGGEDVLAVTATFPCVLEANPTTQMFRLLPIKSEMDKTLFSAHEALERIIVSALGAAFGSDAKIPDVFFGSPS